MCRRTENCGEMTGFANFAVRNTRRSLTALFRLPEYLVRLPCDIAYCHAVAGQIMPAVPFTRMRRQRGLLDRDLGQVVPVIYQPNVFLNCADCTAAYRVSAAATLTCGWGKNRCESL